VNAFIVELEDKAGELARVTGAIAERGIDIVGFAGATARGKGTVVLLTNDEGGTRHALRGAGVAFREVETVMAVLDAKPGSLAATARKLADAGVNIEAAMPTGMVGDQVEVAFASAEPAKARAALGDAAS
jgi:hypothetical protein